VIEVRGFRCSHCDAARRVRRTYATSQSCFKHERACYMNPLNAACATCRKWAVEEDHGHACTEAHDRGPEKVDASFPVRHCPFWEAKP